ncbi:histone-like nucleoid-structuring protein Lsr2 [Streptomyces antarcticus]|uniref:histone-like nucleoid-structuring protein Lsr2 n=1 Tax=Streptomyces antarcticus TaxID=2996458 RepID=UPI00226D7FC0|nr:Lsr2 family protein [Streptomyces sp. H34-AA3]MCY0943485.1 Lsr2 family protein [Streptomyces sp. H34-AA3]
MATKQITTYIDDLDGTETTDPYEIRTVEFGIDGTLYEIDLTDTNADKLRELLAPFKGAARHVGHHQAQAGRPAARPSARVGDALDAKAVRAWAKTQGYTLSNRGRIPLDVQQAYRTTLAGGQAPQPNDVKRQVVAPDTVDLIVSEEEAANHYKELPVPAGREKNWAKREGSGCERTHKIAEMTLMERIESLTAFNLRVLGQLTGDIPVKNGKIKGLGTSSARLRNFEFIDADEFITPFGRYAYRVHAEKSNA